MTTQLLITDVVCVGKVTGAKGACTGAMILRTGLGAMVEETVVVEKNRGGIVPGSGMGVMGIATDWGDMMQRTELAVVGRYIVMGDMMLGAGMADMMLGGDTGLVGLDIGMGDMMPGADMAVVGIDTGMGDMMPGGGKGLVGLDIGMQVMVLGGVMEFVGIVELACPLQYSSSCPFPVTVSYTLCSMFPCSTCRAPDRTWRLSVSLSFILQNWSSWLLEFRKLITALVLEYFIIRVLAEVRVAQSSFRAFSTGAEH